MNSSTNSLLSVRRPEPLNAPPLTVLPNANMELTEVALAALWTGLRDGTAVFLASALTFGVHVGVRSALRAEPGTVVGFMAVSGVATGVATFLFGSGTGTASWRPARMWIGYGTSGLNVALHLVSVLNQPWEACEGTVETAFLIPIYNGLRELGQSQGRRLLPESGLDPRFTPRWERSSNTHRHIGRLFLSAAIYAGVSTALSRWVAVRSLLSPDFNTQDQALNAFAAESMTVFLARAVTEAADTFINIMLLACCFRGRFRRRQGWCSNQTDSARETLLRTASRTSMSTLVQAIQTLIPYRGWCAMLLQGITSFRGSVYSARLNPWVRAGHAPTQRDANCLLHAADGQLHKGDNEWACADPQERRAGLYAAILDLASSNDPNHVAEGHALVKHHLQQAVAQRCADDRMPGFAAVPGGQHRWNSLPVELQQALTTTSLNARESTAGQWLADPAVRDELLLSVAAHYFNEAMPLTHLLVPCLARVLDRPLAVHMADADFIYDRMGNTVSEPVEGTVHIRQGMSEPDDMAVDHFERVEAASPHQGNGRSENGSLNRGMWLDVSEGFSSDSVPLNGNRISGSRNIPLQTLVSDPDEHNNQSTPRNRTPKSAQGQRIQLVTSTNEEHEKGE